MAFFDDTQVAELEIERMVFHLVGPADRHFMLLEEVDPGRFTGFFLDRIRSVNGGAEYTFSDASETRGSLQRIADDPAAFQVESENLASEFQRLHGGATVAGAFLIFALRAGKNQFFALLKYDDETVLGYELKEGRKKGRKRVELESLERTFVQNPAALQKSALVRLTAKGGDLVVMDRLNPQKVALYFEKFLGATRVYEDAELTEKLVQVTREVILANRDLVPPAVYSEVAQRTFDAAARGGVVATYTARNFLETVIGHQLPEEDPLIRKFNNGLKKARIEATPIALDPARVLQPTTLRMVTESNIQIIVPVGVKDFVKVERDRIIINDRLAHQHDAAAGTL